MAQQTGLIPQWGSADDMFSTSQQLVQNAEKLVDQLTNASWYTPQQVDVGFPGIAPPPKVVEPDAPTLQVVQWTTPGAPATFNLLPPNFAGLFPGPFTGVEPTLNFGTLPTPAYGEVPASPQVDLNFSYPTVAEVTLPTAPTLMALDVVSFPTTDIPLFDGEVPTLTLYAPNVTPWSEAWTYTSGLLSELQTEMDEALTNGQDIGLDTLTQQRMWDAAREREYRAQAAALADLERMETLGFAFPPGVYLDARIKIQTETDNTVTGLSRDILVKQAELRLENVTKCRELAVSLEGTLIGYANNVQQRAFESAKYQTEAAIQIYNAGVQAYTARLEGFKATIQAYDAYIEGIKARIAQIQAQVEYEKTKAEIDQALVSMYKTQIDAALAVLEVTKTQVEIIQTEANVEKIKVDIFGAQVQAFVATVNAYTAEVEGYKANAEAQQAIESVYKTQVDAYTAQVQAGASEANALVTGFDAQVKAYEAQVEAYKAALQGMVEQARATSEYNQAATAEYTALVQATAAYNETLTKQWQAIINEQLQVTEVATKMAETNAQLALSSRQISIEAIKGAASVMAQLGAAALGAIHWSNSSQWSLSDSISSSISTSQSTVDEHIYSQSA